VDLRGTGIWSIQLRYGDSGQVRDASTEIEELGYSAIWIPGGREAGVLAHIGRTLAATQRIVVAAGVINIWMDQAPDIAADHAVLARDHPGRLLLGFGVSHAPTIEGGNQIYARPLAKIERYLDDLDSARTPVRASERVLAALGPRMLELARQRSAGAHPYLVTPDHTAVAREVLGPDRLLAPEQMALLSTNVSESRQTARSHLARYLQLPNYTNNMLRHGFRDEDLADGGSDRLVDAMVAHGDVDAVVSRIEQHRQAGADHVCVQFLRPDPTELPLAEWRSLAEAVGGS
jgi:probable F420-dependent oxidoreductase